MKITKVSVKVLQGLPRLKGTASVVFDDCFKVRDILILPKNENEMCIAMPSKKLDDNKRISVAHPINSDFRSEIENAVLKEYDRLQTEGEENEAAYDAEDE